MDAKQLAMFNLIRYEMEQNQFGFDSQESVIVQEVVRILTKYGITVALTKE